MARAAELKGTEVRSLSSIFPTAQSFEAALASLETSFLDVKYVQGEEVRRTLSASKQSELFLTNGKHQLKIKSST